MTRDDSLSLDKSNIADTIGIESKVVSSNTPQISDDEFRYLGFTESQLRILRGESDDMRQVVYLEGLRLLMESGPGYGQTPDGNLNLRNADGF